jgi:nucleotide-binding universal stress UspA family protein
MAGDERTQRRVVVGIDGSIGADEALHWAVGEATSRDGTLEIVSCWMYPAQFGSGPMTGLAKVFPEAARMLCAEAEARAVSFDVAVRTTTRALEAPPTAGLLEACQDAELLVVGSRGAGRFKSMVVGSVSQHCALHAGCSVLVAHPRALPPPSRRHTVVVGFDGSEGATDALEYAVDEAVRLEARLEVVGAARLPRAAPFSPRASATADHMRSVLHDASGIAAKLQPALRVTTVMAPEPAGAALVESSARADLLVVGSRGLGAVPGVLLGSVSRYCVSHAACTTLIVR